MSSIWFAACLKYSPIVAQGLISMHKYINGCGLYPPQKQTDRNFIDNKKSQLDLHVMCIHGMQQQKKTQANVKKYIKCIRKSKILRVTPSFVFLIDRAVSACYMPVARHFQEVKIKYATSILNRNL